MFSIQTFVNQNIELLSVPQINSIYALSEFFEFEDSDTDVVLDDETDTSIASFLLPQTEEEMETLILFHESGEVQFMREQQNISGTYNEVIEKLLVDDKCGECTN